MNIDSQSYNRAKGPEVICPTHDVSQASGPYSISVDVIG